jgi:hypothetical protein
VRWFRNAQLTYSEAVQEVLQVLCCLHRLVFLQARSQQPTAASA